MLLSILFCVWFLSGMVLIFVGFPHYSQSEAYGSLRVLDSATVSAVSFPSGLPKGEMVLEMQDGKAVYRVGKLARTAKTFDAITLKKEKKPTRADCIAAARLLILADTIKVKQIKELDIWLPWEQYQSSLPIYKVYFNDRAKSVVYVSAKSGTIVQLTTRSERFFAAIGAIPHYIIFKYLSIRQPFWNSVLVALLVMGAVVCLSGVVVGIVRMRRGARGFVSPYRNGWIKWHHLTGFYLGIFALTFCLSAYISVAGVPGWIAKGDEGNDYQKEWNRPKIRMEQYQPTFPMLQQLLMQRSDVKRVAFASSLGKPCYQLYTHNALAPEVYMIDGSMLVPLKGYNTNEILNYANKVTGDMPVSIELLQRFDSYYQLTKMGSRPLPVLRIVLHDSNSSWLYVSTKSGELVTVFDKSRRAERWLYRALHTFNIQWLKEHELLRKMLLLLVCAAGTVISISGLMLTLKWLKRKVKRYSR